MISFNWIEYVDLSKKLLAIKSVECRFKCGRKRRRESWETKLGMLLLL